MRFPQKVCALISLNRRKSIAAILPRRGNFFSFSLGEKAGMRADFFPHQLEDSWAGGGNASG
jgi:hypothetical protein